MEEKPVFVSRIFNKPEVLESTEVRQQDMFPDQVAALEDPNERLVTFTGTVEETCYPEVTFKDEHKLPYSSPNIQIEYQFPFLTLNVMSRPHDCFSTMVRGELSQYHFPERDLFDPRTDQIYDRIKTMLLQAAPKAIENEAIAERYPELSLAVKGVIDRPILYPDITGFSRIVTIETDACDDSVDKAKAVEQLLIKTYGLESIDEMTDSAPLSKYKRGVYLSGDLRVVIDCAYVDQFALVMPQFFTEDKYKQFSDLIVCHEAVKDRNPRVEKDNHFTYFMRFVLNPAVCGDVIIAEAFKEDLAQLPVIPYGTRK